MNPLFKSGDMINWDYITVKRKDRNGINAINVIV